jgi:hypothetical protein
MNKKCPDCQLINYANANNCIRCGSTLGESVTIASNRGFLNSNLLKRTVVCIGVLLAILAGFYASLLFSADRLGATEQAKIDAAIGLLEEKGFHDEVFILRNVAVFRASDNWLNASVQKESAYAATNFPFEIVTIYPDFFRFAQDEVEMGAILLHESKHLQGKDEKEAYEFVWKNRDRLGWTADEYLGSEIWRETRKLTREYVPILFVCELNDYSDCTG